MFIARYIGERRLFCRTTAVCIFSARWQLSAAHRAHLRIGTGVSPTSTGQRYNKTWHLYGERQRSGTALTSFMHALPLCASSLPSSLATSAKDIPLSVFFCRSFATRECTASIVAAIVTRRLSSSRVSVSKTKSDRSSRGSVVLATQYIETLNNILQLIAIPTEVPVAHSDG